MQKTGLKIPTKFHEQFEYSTAHDRCEVKEDTYDAHTNVSLDVWDKYVCARRSVS